MDKNTIKETIKSCNKGIDDAETSIAGLTAKEIIELKAKLKGRSIHYDKWILILIPFTSMTIAALAAMLSDPDSNKVWVEICIFILLVLAVVVFCLHIKNQLEKEKDVITLNYLEELADSSNKAIESYEELEKKQKIERKQLLEEWKKKEKYAQEQVTLIEKSLKDKEQSEE